MSRTKRCAKTVTPNMKVYIDILGIEHYKKVCEDNFEVGDTDEFKEMILAIYTSGFIAGKESQKKTL